MSKLSDQSKAKRLQNSLAQVRIGQDELNLAIFPIAVLDKREQRTKRYLEFEETVEIKSGTVTRKWTISGHAKEGLPSPRDEDLYVGLMELTREQGATKKVYFSRYDLLKRLGWPINQSSYDRLEQGLLKLSSLHVNAVNAYVDSGGNPVTVGMTVIQEYKLHKENANSAPKSYIVWSDRIAQSISSQFIKRLDSSFYFDLSSPIAKRLFRYLDRRFGKDTYFFISIQKLAFEHIGLSRGIKYTSQVMQRLTPALDELVAKQFLVKWERDSNDVIHFYKNQHFGDRIQMSLPMDEVMISYEEEDLPNKEIVDNSKAVAIFNMLIKHRLMKSVAEKIVLAGIKESSLSSIEAAIAYFESLKKKKYPMSNPPGFLCHLIANGVPATPEEAVEEVESVSETEGEIALQMLEVEYMNYLDQLGETEFAKLSENRAKTLLDKKRADLLTSQHADTFKRWSASQLNEHARKMVKRDLARKAAIPFQAWCSSRGNRSGTK